MHPNDLRQFRDDVAYPAMMRLFENTHIPDGTCFIDNLEVFLLDGRSCGHENRICASGFLYREGLAEEYSYDECDVDLAVFFAEHKDCIFISDGLLRLEDELDEMDLSTRIRNIKGCGRFFHWFDAPKEINIELTSVQYEKLKYLLTNQQKEEKKPSLGALIQSASKESAQARSDNNLSAKEPDPER